MLSSLAPGPGEFPSISSFDQSLIPSHHAHVPPSPHEATRQIPMPTIPEEKSPQDLDPFMDSVEVEFGLDSRSAFSQPRAHVQRPQLPGHGPPLTPSSPPLNTHYELDSESGYHTPPPSYEAVVSGSYMAVDPGTQYFGEGSMGFEASNVPPKGPYDVPRSSSTPLLRGSPQDLMRLRYRDAHRTHSDSNF